MPAAAGGAGGAPAPLEDRSGQSSFQFLRAFAADPSMSGLCAEFQESRELEEATYSDERYAWRTRCQLDVEYAVAKDSKCERRAHVDRLVKKADCEPRGAFAVGGEREANASARADVCLHAAEPGARPHPA